MAVDFDTFCESDLGAHIESMLGVRGCQLEPCEEVARAAAGSCCYEVKNPFDPAFPDAPRPWRRRCSINGQALCQHLGELCASSSLCRGLSWTAFGDCFSCTTGEDRGICHLLPGSGTVSVISATEADCDAQGGLFFDSWGLSPFEVTDELLVDRVVCCVATTQGVLCKRWPRSLCTHHVGAIVESCDDLDCSDEAFEGACCFPGGLCINMTAAACDQIEGTHWESCISCSIADCRVGACCLGPDNCEERTASGCLLDSGRFRGEGITCEETDCNFGACCHEINSFQRCDETTEAGCQTLAGSFQGSGSLCRETDCQFGACCQPDRCREFFSGSLCEDQGGIFQGFGTTCELGQLICDPLLGACCFRDGTCTDATQQDCLQLNGDHQGDGTRCDSLVCPDLIVGACCFSNGVCTITTDTNCLSRGGVYQGDDTLCTPGLCPEIIKGACCLLDGSCERLSPEACADRSGVYKGDHVSCGAVFCEPDEFGACCKSGDCVERFRSDCHGINGSFVGPDTLCTFQDCERGACCGRDEICRGRELRSKCIADGGRYFGDGKRCEIENNCEIGACCFPGGGCSENAQSPCENADGLWQGAQSRCVSAECNMGACCEPDGDCRDTAFEDCDGIWFQRRECRFVNCPTMRTTT